MTRRPRSLTALAAAFFALTAVARPSVAEESPRTELPIEYFAGRKVTGDFDEMLRWRYMRVLVVHSQMLYFVNRGHQGGLIYEFFKHFEDEVNRERKNKRLRFHVIFVPVPHDELIPRLVGGLGDVAAANLTVTPERTKRVAFSTPLFKAIDEIAVTGPRSPTIASVEDLSGKEVFVRKSSSYYEHLVELNRELKKKGKPDVVLEAAPEELEDEELLEMVNAGLIEIVVVDSHIARFWSQVFDDIRLHEDVVVHKGGDIAWMMREGSPKLKAALDRYLARHGAGQAFGNQIFRRYLKDAKYVKDSAAEAEIPKESSELLSGGKLSTALGVEAMNSVGAPADQLVEIIPHSFIAVRTRKLEAEMFRRAAEIRALLSATMALRARRLQAIASSPTQVAWFLKAGTATLQVGAPAKASIIPVANEHVLLKAIAVSQAAIRESLASGNPIPNSLGWDWDITPSSSIVQLFVSKVSKAQVRLLDAAILTQEAVCATTYETQLQVAVAAMEVVSGHNGFEDLKRILKAFFPGKDQEERIGKLIALRHEITHEGAGYGDMDQRAKSAAEDALMFSWMLIDAAAAFMATVPKMSWDEYLELLTIAQRLDQRTSKLAGAKPGAHERLLHSVLPAFHNALALRVEWKA